VNGTDLRFAILGAIIIFNDEYDAASCRAHGGGHVVGECPVFKTSREFVTIVISLFRKTSGPTRLRRRIGFHGRQCLRGGLTEPGETLGNIMSL